jgi:hypothetical protein
MDPNDLQNLDNDQNYNNEAEVSEEEHNDFLEAELPESKSNF